MAEKDIHDLAQCVYMFDLVLREIMNSPKITKKEYATQRLIESFALILREEGYNITQAKLKKMLAYAH